MPLQIHSIEHIIRIVAIKLTGRFDAFEAPKVRVLVDENLNKNICHLVFDLSEVEMLDSAGLAVMVSALKRTRQQNGDVRIVWPHQEAAARILRLTKFDQVFTSITPEQILPSGF